MKLRNLGTNMAELEMGDVTVFFSYNTPVACLIAGKGYFRTEKFHSVTTSKHINKWLGRVIVKKRPQEFFDNLLNGGEK